MKSILMKSILTGFLGLLLTNPLWSQHYYKDLLVTSQNMQKRQIYQQTKVKGVKFLSFDANNEPIEGFSSEQTIANNYLQISTVTSAPVAGTSQTISLFNSTGQLVKTTDTAEGVKNFISYEYDGRNRIVNIINTSVSPGDFVLKEQHVWAYDKDGKPQKMMKIKNDTDTSYISFILDDKGNVAEEKTVHKGKQEPTVYYYYDDKNRLTDIVRFNAKARRLLPDYIFEYDNKGRLTSMMVVQEGTGDYQKWYYTYNDQDLKTLDACFSKTKVLIGKIEYRYQF